MKDFVDVQESRQMAFNLLSSKVNMNVNIGMQVTNVTNVTMIILEQSCIAIHDLLQKLLGEE